MDEKGNQIFEQVADRILELLDQGELPPWHRPWRSSGTGGPMNAISMKPYRGINQWLTLLTQQVMGYSDPRWLTFKQAKSLGGHISKGEKSTRVVIWKKVPKKEKEENGETSYYRLLRLYRVFNVEQTENCGLAEMPAPNLTDHDPIETAQAIIDAMPNPPGFSTYLHADTAPHYSPDRDQVRVPAQGRYDLIEQWYNTVFHELVHSTGHPSRLDRLAAENWSGEIHAYGREELVAGMGSAMLSARAGLEQETILMDAAYVKHWSEAIRGDKTIVVRAAGLAQRAVDFITGYVIAGETHGEETGTKTEEKETRELQPA